MSDLTERLRALGDVRTSALYHQRVILNGAADEIDRLTRELAEAREALSKAEAYIPPETVECRGDKCRQLWCVSCFGEEEAEREIERAKFLAEEIHTLKEKP